MPPSPLRTLASLPLFALVAGFVMAAIVLASRLVGTTFLDSAISADESIYGASFIEVIAQSWSFALATGTATFLVTSRFLRRRGHPLALPNRRSAAEILVGLGLGAIPALVAGIAYLLSGAEVAVNAVDGPHLLAILGSGILLLFPMAVAEEWLFRDYTLSALTPHVGATAAVVVSSIVFAFAHWANPGGASWLAMIDIVIAGIGLGTAYVVTRSLWIASCWHFSWNFFLGVVLGLPVSGLHVESWLSIAPVGPWWWTGGTFGPEASVISIGADLVAVSVFLVIARIIPRENWSGVDTIEAQI